MTSAKTAEGRKTVLSVGSAPLMTRSRSRSRSRRASPSRAGRCRRRRRRRGRRSSRGARSPASRAGTARSGSPRPRRRGRRRARPRTRSRGSRARRGAARSRKSVAAARMCRPIVVRAAGARAAPRATAATTMATIVTLRTSTPPTSTARFSGATDDAGSPIVPSRRSTSSAIACSRNAIAKVVTSITAGDCVAQRPEDRALHRERQRDDDDEAGERCSPRRATST